MYKLCLYCISKKKCQSLPRNSSETPVWNNHAHKQEWQRFIFFYFMWYTWLRYMTKDFPARPYAEC
jgi:hypothetical protein